MSVLPILTKMKLSCISCIATILSSKENFEIIIATDSKIFSKLILLSANPKLLYKKSLAESENVLKKIINLKIESAANDFSLFELQDLKFCFNGSLESNEIGPIEKLLLHKNHLFLATGSCLYFSKYQSKNAVLSFKLLRNFDQSGDINDFVISTDKLIVCLDNGSIELMDLRIIMDKEESVTIERESTTKGEHAILTSVVSLRPTLPWHLLSGGFDCKLMHWDLVKGSCKYVHDFSISAQNSSLSLCNPPYIHAIASSPSGNKSAVGLANGKIVVLFLNRSLKCCPENSLKEIILSSHTWTVSQLLFIKEDLLVSGSIDQSICLWRIDKRNHQSLLERIQVDFKINTMEVADCKDFQILSVGGAGKNAFALFILSNHGIAQIS